MFTWRRVRGAGHTPDGRYASDPVDQHAASWCGACYLVAAAQMVQDRAHVALARQKGRWVVPPRLSLQALLDHHEEFEAAPGWCACHGGFPLHVLQCMERGECPLVLSDPCDRWWGFPRLVRSCPRPDARFSVRDARRVAPDAVREALRDGPVVLEVSAETLKRVNARGVVEDLAWRDPDHAACVVGWERDCWIVRNSWGKERVPEAVPDDAEQCVARGHNACDVVAWQPWSGDPRDPGFLLLPQSFPPLHHRWPSPWIACTVETHA